MFQVQGSTQAKRNRQMRIQSLEAEKKIQYKSLNIKIKAKQSTETEEIRAGMRISPISILCQSAKGFAMTAIRWSPRSEHGENASGTEATSLEETDPHIATW